MRSRFTAGHCGKRILQPQVISARVVDTVEAWDAFFSDFYLRAYAQTDDAEVAQEQALAAVRLSGCRGGRRRARRALRLRAPHRAAGPRGLSGGGRRPLRTLLEEARRRTGHERWPKLTRADYRELPFADESFDAALNLFTSLGYLGDRPTPACWRRSAGSCARARAWSSRPCTATSWSRASRSGLALLGEGRLLLERRTFDPEAGVAQSTQTLIDGAGARESRTFSVRTYTATELLAMLARAGFGEAKCYGALDGSPFSVSTRLVIVARR